VSKPERPEAGDFRPSEMLIQEDVTLNRFQIFADEFEAGLSARLKDQS
jgi:hypothetical protein